MSAAASLTLQQQLTAMISNEVFKADRTCPEVAVAAYIAAGYVDPSISILAARQAAIMEDSYEVELELGIFKRAIATAIGFTPADPVEDLSAQVDIDRPNLASDESPPIHSTPGADAGNSAGENQQEPKSKRVTNTCLIGTGIQSTIHAYTQPPTGLLSGLTDVDRKFGRLLKPGTVHVCAARPSMGKTVYGVQVVEYHAELGLNVLIWSIEMSLEQLITRLIAKHSGVTIQDLENQGIKDSDWPAITAAAEKIHALPLFVNDMAAVSIEQIDTETRVLHQELLDTTGKGLGLVVIDYIQLASSEEKKQSREMEVSAISGGLRCLAKNLHIPFLILAQLNRELEKRSDKRPMLSDLRESGAIEMDATVVSFLYRESIYCEDCRNPKIVCSKNHEHDAEFIVGKNRGGTIGSVEIIFNGERQMFADMAHEDKEFNVRMQKEADERKAADVHIKPAETKVKANVHNDRRPFTPTPKSQVIHS